MKVSFKCTDDERKAIKTCVDRAIEKWPEFDRMNLTMDLTATNANGCKLDFNRLIAFDDFNFAHDVFGIANTIDRKTGKLTNHFLPRCSR